MTTVPAVPDVPAAPRAGPLRTFWFLWAVDALVALVFVYFFFIGIADGTVSSFNIGLWLVILLVLGAVLLGSYGLRRAGRTGWAIALALVLAVPGLLYGLFFLILILSNPTWN